MTKAVQSLTGSRPAYNPDWLRYCKRVVRAGMMTDHLLMPEIDVTKRRLGSDYGGWVVADRPLRAMPRPIVLSFGLGDDISFDEDIIRSYDAIVYGFDPTVSDQAWFSGGTRPADLQVFPIGISKRDGTQTFSLLVDDGRGNFSTKAVGGNSITCDVMRYTSILELLKLSRVDVLKLDVEGSEYEVIPDIVGAPVRPTQLLVEFHHRLHDIRVAETRRAVKLIKQAGYRLFSVSPAGQEMSFIRP